MDGEPNPIKDILYEVITNLGESNIEENIAKGNTQEIIKKIILNSREKISKVDGILQINMAKMLTSLLHYLLTIVLIPSQRKVSLNDIEVDIVIPNLKTLREKPNDSILLCIPEIHELNIEKQIQLMQTIQPIKENIWYITEKNLNHKTYSLNDNSFFEIIDDINKFLSNTKSFQFRFFKV